MKYVDHVIVGTMIGCILFGVLSYFVSQDSIVLMFTLGASMVIGLAYRLVSSED